ncbi:hypothetical protein NQU17_15095 [Clostridiaceae bacterium HFYG-1003]|nr:hypothetical protein NQU17_15095 [Clostridiaceae bacterium HFYG-1003]
MLKAKRRIRLPRSDRPAEDLRQGFMNCDRMMTQEGQEMENVRRSRFAFGLGPVGRALRSPLVSRCFFYDLTDVLDMPDETVWTMTGVRTLRWILDAVKDLMRKGLVDKTQTRWAGSGPGSDRRNRGDRQAD